MTDSALSFYSQYFNSIWSLFSITWPGTTVPIYLVLFGVLGTVISINVFRKFLGTSILLGAESVGGNNKNIKVSSNRKGDSK